MKFLFRPVVTKGEVIVDGLPYPGKISVSNAVIDFERSQNPVIDNDGSGKIKSLTVDGLEMIGVLPIRCLREDVWECSVDYLK